MLQQQIVRCQRCPRLVRYLESIKLEYPTYWCKPVPAFGSSEATIVLIGLAPGRFGSNRTGRMFTGDASGDFLYPVLHKCGLASKAKAQHADDGLQLDRTLITAAVRCAPPQNRPTRQEIRNCVSFLEAELALLARARVVIALGKIAHDEYVRIRLKREKGRFRDFPFAHGRVHYFQREPKVFIDSYHPSRQNTNTGKLTKTMFRSVFTKAVCLSGCGKSAA